MSILTSTGDFQVPHFPVRRFSVEEYHRMIAGGILEDGDPVELLQGWIVPKMARNPPHDTTLDAANVTVRAILPKGWRLRVQSAITTPDSEPEPDLAVVRGPASRYRTRHPFPEEIATVIEVAESSLAKDRDEKGPIYAAARIPYYWIINLVDNVVEVYSEPGERHGKAVFQTSQVKGMGEEVTLFVDGIEVGRLPVRRLFGLEEE